MIGEVIADFVPAGAGGTFYEAVTGGSGFNTALALARLGLAASLGAPLSGDALGRRFRARLAEERVDLGWSARSALPMPLAVVTPGAASADGMFSLYLEGTANGDAPALPAALPGSVAHVHAASFLALRGPSAAPSLSLLGEAKARATSSFDPNIRAACLPPRAETLALVEARVAAASLVKASEEDLAWLYPGLAPHEALERWRALGARLAVLTRGPRGALALGPEGFCEVPAPQVAVADTVGAGDSFTAGLLAAMAADGALGVSGFACGPERLSRWLARAAAVAADTCTRPGCDPPRGMPEIAD